MAYKPSDTYSSRMSRRGFLEGALALGAIGLERLVNPISAMAQENVKYRKRGFYDKSNRLVAVIVSDIKNDPVDVWTDYKFKEGPVTLDSLEDIQSKLSKTAEIEIDDTSVRVYLSPEVKASFGGGYLNIKYTEEAAQEREGGEGGDGSSGGGPSGGGDL